MGTDTLIDLMQDIYRSPKSIQSNFCRMHAHSIARLASIGLITTAFSGSFGGHWRLTYKGLRVLEYGDSK